MIAVKFDSTKFLQEMTNIVKYSEGFIEGAQAGKVKLLDGLAADLSEVIKSYIDSNARVNPQMLHHIYEWHQIGQPGARLFDINYIVSNNGISFNGTLSQSRSIKDGSNVPFYNKATIMENGIPVTIKPKTASALRFEQDGNVYYVRGSVNVNNPGGIQAQDGFREMFDSFFRNPMTQSFLVSSGIKRYLETPKIYKANLAKGKRGGRAVGYETGMKWMSNAAGGVIV
jgi:hypothetical protein